MNRVLIIGDSGSVGRKPAQELTTRSDQVAVAMRNARHANGQFHATLRCAAWTLDNAGTRSPARTIADVVHLADERVAKHGHDQARKRIESSSIDSTHRLIKAIGRDVHKPAIFISRAGLRRRRQDDLARLRARDPEACARSQLRISPPATRPRQ